MSCLTPGEKYIFALAAYDGNGELIGGSVGESTRPILASHPLSLLVGWSHLCQVIASRVEVDFILQTEFVFYCLLNR